MTVKLPEGSILRKAVRWISEQRESAPGASLVTLIEEAGKNFDLSPKDCEFLIHFFTGTDRSEPITSWFGLTFFLEYVYRYYTFFGGGVMEASVLDLRYKMKTVLEALERREEVRILYHGKIKGTIVPASRKREAKIADHPFFGMKKR